MLFGRSGRQQARPDRVPGKLADEINFGRASHTWQEYDLVHYQILYYDAQRTIIPGLLPSPTSITNEARVGHHSVTDRLVIAAIQSTRHIHYEIDLFDNQH